MRIFGFILCLMLCSCKLVRLTTEEHIVFKSSQLKLQSNNNSLEVKVKIDDSEELFLFDTGASNTAVFDTTLIKDFSKKGRISLFKVKDPSGKLSVFYTPANIETDMFIYKNQLVSILPKIENYCNKSYGNKGVIGSSFFKKSELKYYYFDFDNLLLKNSKDIPIDSDFSEVKSKFFNTYFTLYLTINGHEEPFLFDTGNTASPLIIGGNSSINPLKFYEYLGSEGIIASGNVKADTKYSNDNDVLMSMYKMNIPICFSSMKMGKYNNMGLGFIKYFNWIIDFENKKVYFKRNNVSYVKPDIIPKYKYLCMIINKQLKIITKSKEELLYNLYDEIVAVNSKRITPENICEMQSLLNKTNDWETLNLEVIPEKTK